MRETAGTEKSADRMDEKHSDPSTMTMHEIDLFENRLQLKTLQEGLKHKVASTDITPDLVHGIHPPTAVRTAHQRAPVRAASETS